MTATSKLGPHCITPTADALRLAKHGTIALLLDDFGQADAMRFANPMIEIIGRSFQGEFDARWQYEHGQDPVLAARNFLKSSSQSRIYELNPQIKIWTGHVEFNPATIAEMAWYSAFEVERLRRLAAAGLRGCVGNFAVGNPPFELWPAFYPALRETILQDGILGLHEYAALWMWWMTGDHQIDPAEDEGDEGWTTLRYRKAMRSWPRELQEVQIAVTECGLDLVSPPPFPGGNGNWRNCIQWWADSLGGNQPIDYWWRGGRDPEIYYAEQLIWYEKELRKDKNVIGACIFIVGG